MKKTEVKVYHGTTSVQGVVICRTMRFNQSTECDDWLGRGIYFWAMKKDAWWWAKTQRRGKKPGYKPSVISTTLHYNDDKFLNLDDPTQMDSFVTEMETVFKSMGHGTGAPKFKDNHEKQNFCCDYYKRKYNIELIAYTFPNSSGSGTRIQVNVAGFPTVPSRKQYCATDNSIISKLEMEVEDYAV